MSISCAKWRGGWSENEKVENIMNRLLGELSEEENSFQDYHTPFANYARQHLHGGSNEMVK